MENVEIKKLTEKFGTPLYAYSKESIVKEYRSFAHALKGIGGRIHYAVKANANVELLKILKREGCSFDVDSEGEMRAATKAGARGKDIIFTGPGKSSEELAFAIQKGCRYIAVESLQEAALIKKLARTLLKKIDVSIRVNPDIRFKTHAYIATGEKKHKFGVSPQNALRIFEFIKQSKYVRLVGINAHIGCQIENPDTRKLLAARLISIALTLNAKGAAIQYIDLGGGFPYDYRHQKTFDAKKYFEPTARLFKRYPQFTLVIEPGRRIVAGAGILLAKVLYTKENYGNHFTVIDAAMNDLIRPALYGATHRIVPLQATSRPKQLTSVVGPICESADFFANRISLPLMKPGEFLAVLDTGAYGFIMSSNYGLRRKPAEILVDQNKYRLIRKRQTYEQAL